VYPIRKAGVIAFIDWLSRTHPEVMSLRDTPKRQFLNLVVEFEASKGLRIDEQHQVYRKWESTHWEFTESSSDEEALLRLR
jgi:hypothetical protein